ncbi:MAG: fumarylacetoacetate hydrolase family protein [Ardenticatenaceae bacterium]|nr:fumarylacetoacetate hydrolase family protein [Ardenticatenaceae bacterium]
MRLVTYVSDNSPHLGVVRGTAVLDVARLGQLTGGTELPDSMLGLFDAGPIALTRLKEALAVQTNDALREAGGAWLLSETTLLAPIPRPRKNIFCLGKNYAEHARESNRARGESDVAPEAPLFFTKAPTSVIGPDAPILIHPLSDQVDWEIELAVVIGRRGRNLRAAEAMDFVFGYTILNDVSARDVQWRHGRQFFKGKSLDGSCPLGPWIVTADEIPNVHGLTLRLWVNGVLKQEGHTTDLIYDIPTIIASLAEGMTLEAGDIIATGTPGGVGFARQPPEFLRPGDVVEQEIEGIGRMRNPVALAES